MRTSTDASKSHCRKGDDTDGTAGSPQHLPCLSAWASGIGADHLLEAGCFDASDCFSTFRPQEMLVELWDYFFLLFSAATETTPGPCRQKMVRFHTPLATRTLKKCVKLWDGLGECLAIMMPAGPVGRPPASEPRNTTIGSRRRNSQRLLRATIRITTFLHRSCACAAPFASVAAQCFLSPSVFTAMRFDALKMS